MQFRIADTFTASLARLTGERAEGREDYGLRPTDWTHSRSEACNFTRSKGRETATSGPSGLAVTLGSSSTGPKTASCSATSTTTTTPIDGPSGRKLETHPKTGAAQLVEVRETVEEIAVPVYVPVAQEAQSRRLLFSSLPDDQLLSYGVPVEWLPDIRAADEDSILDLAEPPTERGCRSAAGAGYGRDTTGSQPSCRRHRPVRPP